MSNILRNRMNFTMSYFFCEIMEIEKIERRICYLHRKFKTSIRDLNHGLVLKKVHRVIKIDRKAWLKSYTDAKEKLRKNAKMIPKKTFFKLTNNAVFRKSKENVRKRRDIKLLTTEPIIY